METFNDTAKLKRPKWPMVMSVILLVFAIVFAFFPLYFPWIIATNDNIVLIYATIKSGDDWGEWYLLKTEEFDCKFVVKGASEEQLIAIESLDVGNVVKIGLLKSQYENYLEESQTILDIVQISHNENEIYSLEDYNKNIKHEKAEMTKITSCGAGFLALSSVGLFLFYMLRKKRIKVVEV